MTAHSTVQTMASPTKTLAWYDHVIDDILTNPSWTYVEAAARLGRSAATISLTVNSDMFKARLAQRRADFNEELNQRLVSKMGRLAEKALDLQQEQLDKKQTAVPLPVLNDMTDKLLTKLGYGIKPAAPTAVQVNVNNGPQVASPVSAEVLEAARADLRRVESSRSESAPPAAAPRLELQPPMLEQEVVEVSDPQGVPLGAALPAEEDGQR